MHNTNVPQNSNSDINSSVGFSDTFESRKSRNSSSPLNTLEIFPQDSSEESLEVFDKVSSENPLLRFHLEWIHHCRQQIKNLKLNNQYGFWKSIIKDCIDFHNKRIMEILVKIGTSRHPYPEEDLTGRLSLDLPRQVLNKYLNKEK